MKKNRFALLIFMVLCLTIAGAYATWNYVAGQNIDPLNEVISVNLAKKTHTTADGGKLTAAGGASFTIDDDGTGAYKAALVSGGEGFTIKYDATTSKTPEITAIHMKATVTVNCTVEWNGTSVLVAKEANVIRSQGAVSEWTISPADILSCVELADITLPTPGTYDNFSDALKAGQIQITVTIEPLTEQEIG